MRSQRVRTGDRNIGRYYQRHFEHIRRKYPGFRLSAVEPHLNIIRTADMVFRAMGRYLVPHGLTPPSVGVLILLESAEKPVPMRRLSEGCVVTQANITGLVNTLEKRGFVSRRSQPGDRRVTLAEITTPGRRKLKKILPGWFRLINSIYSGLGRKESSALCRCLEKVRARLTAVVVLVFFAVLPARAGKAETLSLRDAVTLAVSNSLSLQEGRSALDQAFGAQLRLLGSYDTSLSASIKRLDSKTPPAVFFQPARTVSDSFEMSLSRRFVPGTLASVTGSFTGEKDDVTSDYWLNPRAGSGVTLSVSQPLLKGLRGMPGRAALRASVLAVRSAKASLEHSTQQLARRVAFAYWELWKSRQRTGVMRASEEESREFLETTKKLFKRFEAEKDDLLRAEADLLKRQLEVLSSEKLAGDRAGDLCLLLTVEREGIEDLRLEEPPEPGDKVSQEESFSRALDNRRDLAALKFRAEGAKLDLDASAGLGLPELDLTGSWGWAGLKESAGESFSQLGRMGYMTWSVGLNLSYTFGARSDRGERLEVETSRLLADSRIEDLRLVIKRDTATAVRRLNLAGETVRISRKLENMQNEILEISRKKYAQGRITSRDRLQAADAALAARNAGLGAAADYASALAEHKAAEGTILKWLGTPSPA